MKVLLIGKNGQLGRELKRKGVSKGVSIAAAGSSEVDITQPKQIEIFFHENKPSIAINAAAYTAVDLAESEREKCFAVNRDGPQNLARTCLKFNVPLIHISTDYVFDGGGRTPYHENHPVRPLGVYGRSKAEGEKSISLVHKRHVIIRTSWLYGVFGKNFVKSILRAIQEKRTLKVVNDQCGSPTCAEDLADAVLSVCESIFMKQEEKWGIYHYCGKGVTTWYEFAKAILKFAHESGVEKEPEIFPITTKEYPTAAKRPRFSALDCTKIKNTFGVTPKPWRDCLKATIGKILVRPDFLS